MKDKRDKAFLGALIGGTLGLAGSAIGGIMGRKAQKRQLRKQQIAQNRSDTYEMAQNLTAGYGNQEYVDDFQNKVSFRNGGKIRYTDRLKRNKKYRCGGRKKAKLGTWNSTDSSDVLSGALSGLGNVITSAIASKPIGTVNSIPSAPSIAKDNINVPDYVANGAYNPRFRCGGRKYRKSSK